MMFLPNDTNEHRPESLDYRNQTGYIPAFRGIIYNHQMNKKDT